MPFRLPARLAVAAAVAWLSATAATAGPVTYHFDGGAVGSWIDNSGHNFATYANPAHHLTLDITVAGPLAGLGTAVAFSDVTAQLQSWSYDGGQAFTTVNQLSAAGLFSLSLWTDAAGAVLGHRFIINHAAVSVPGLPSGTAATMYVDSGAYTQERIDYPSYLRCQGVDLHGNPYCYSGSEGGATPLNVGVWTLSAAAAGAAGGGAAAAVPEPAALPLALLGLGGLVAARRRGGRVQGGGSTRPSA